MAKRPNRDDIDKFHDTGLYLPTRTIYIGSEGSESGEEDGVDYEMAKTVVKNLHILDTSSSEPIKIIMNNPGGDTYHCAAIYDAIKDCKSHITIYVYGYAMSSGSVILQAADERVMAPSSVQMIHYGSGVVGGHAKTLWRQSKESERLNEWMEDIYLARIKERHPTFTLSKLRKLLDHDTFLTAKESVELGLCDKIKE